MITKRKFGLVVFLLCLIGVLSAYHDSRNIIENKTSTTNKTACINAERVLQIATVQKEILDQQALISAVSGKREETAVAATQASELESLIKVFEDLVSEQSLDCQRYTLDSKP